MLNKKNFFNEKGKIFKYEESSRKATSFSLPTSYIPDLSLETKYHRKSIIPEESEKGSKKGKSRSKSPRIPPINLRITSLEDTEESKASSNSGAIQYKTPASRYPRNSQPTFPSELFQKFISTKRSFGSTSKSKPTEESVKHQPSTKNESTNAKTIISKSHGSFFDEESIVESSSNSPSSLSKSTIPQLTEKGKNRRKSWDPVTKKLQTTVEKIANLSKSQSSETEKYAS